jgi:hypothetical protein
MPNNDFQSPNITLIGSLYSNIGTRIKTFSFSNKDYDDIVIVNAKTNVLVLFGGPTFSTLPPTLPSSQLDGTKGFQTTGGTTIAGHGYEICGVKNFLGDGRNAMVLGFRGEGSDRDTSLVNFYSYVIFYSPTIGPLLDVTNGPHVLKFQGEYSSTTNDVNGFSVDAITINGKGVIAFGAPGAGNSNSQVGAVNFVCGQSITDITRTIRMGDVTALKINGRSYYGQLGYSLCFIPDLNGNPAILIGEPGASKAYVILLNANTLCNPGQSLDVGTLNGANGVAITSTIPNFASMVTYGNNIFGKGKPAIVISAPTETTTSRGEIFVIPLDSRLFMQSSISIDQLRADKRAILISGLNRLSSPPIGIYKNDCDKDAILLGSCSTTGQIISISENDTDINASQADGKKVINVPAVDSDGILSDCTSISMVAGDIIGNGAAALIKAVPGSSLNGISSAGCIDVYYPIALPGRSAVINCPRILPPSGSPNNSSASSLSIIAVLAGVGGSGSLLLIAFFLLFFLRRNKFQKSIATQENNSHKKIIHSLAKKIFAKFATTRCGYITQSAMTDYINAIKDIVIALETQGVDLQDAKIAEAVIKQIKLVNPAHSSIPLFSSPITPKLLETHCATIANGAAIELGYAEPGEMPAQSVVNMDGDRRDHSENETAEIDITAKSPSTRRSTRRTTDSRKNLLPTTEEGEQHEFKIQPGDFQEGVVEKTKDGVVARLHSTPAGQPETLQTNAESDNELNEEDFKEGEAEVPEYKSHTPGENGIVVILPLTPTDPDEPAESRRMRM